ncbi:hypothetical protein BDY21DRAFT_330962 [Lineolata rhizophorae]|uniref:Uncharacterized protein n=1 Tax=Lineolata rhizophorae TaxID=578093 RepID=A0A6A6PEX9_9PEZI|nr:hypothetical protein BDY21DRAFT_330962 [Lineolata rhizophorae]
MSVRVCGEEQYCKLAVNQTKSAVKREFTCLKAISDSGLPLSVRVPRLIGLIQSDNNTTVLRKFRYGRYYERP